MEFEHQPVTKNERTWGLMAHLASFAGYILPLFGNILGPLIVYLIKKDESEFIADQARESLNFQISFLIYAIVSGFLIIILVGAFLLAILPILQLIFVIIAAIKANDGVNYRYPMTIRFIK
ncbi:DUF4870 domain-containing protein [Bacillus solimangrovi]|uniref:Orotate phosphoribosyltransferase n=1 Tax=Bacillus solimangrovi TaxID=1305675 RepID=A0A1E5LEE1_9BACI|nr:DUF4870 domain-containing protein [Bacillus solimangrovi]OEH92442.1 orotate phosphoribosyltransferase [Bacillus solimangrovi]